MTDFKNQKHYLAHSYRRKMMRGLIVAGLVLLSMFVAGSPAESQTLEQVKKTHIEKVLSTSDGQQIKKSVEKYSELYKVDKYLIYAVIMTESGFNKNAKSPCGATGLMQLMPRTFNARKTGENIWDIDQNTHAGTKHLAGLIAKYKGNVYLALSAYNIGGGAQDRYGTTVHPATKHYVDKVFYHKTIIEKITL